MAKSKELYQGVLHDSLRIITEAVARTFEVQMVSVWLFTENRSMIRCVDMYELSTDNHSQGMELKAADYPAYFKALAKEELIAAHDAHNDPRTREFLDSYLAPFGITSMLDVPIRLKGQIIGAVCYEHVGPPRKWTMAEQNFAHAPADYISLAMEAEERRQAEEELAKYRDHLEELVKERTRDLEAAQEELVKREKLSVLGQLTATVSHEIRNPLGVIRASAYYLQRKSVGKDEKTAKHLNRIEEQVALCDTIVGDLLEYTRGSRSEVIHGKINPLLEKVLEEIATPEQVTLVSELSPELTMVLFDRDKIRRVVINLILNAFTAVTMRREKWNNEQGPYHPLVKVTSSAADNGIRIEVEDNGIGMDDETARRAFEPLFTTWARGTGLGLAIVKKIVEEHGGSVSLDSILNHGTKVTVIIPKRVKS